MATGCDHMLCHDKLYRGFLRDEFGLALGCIWRVHGDSEGGGTRVFVLNLGCDHPVTACMSGGDDTGR